MSLRARRLASVALAAGLAFGCADASAARGSTPPTAVTAVGSGHPVAAAPITSATSHEKRSEAPTIRKGIRPGVRTLQCRPGGGHVSAANDGSPPSGKILSPAQTLRRYFESQYEIQPDLAVLTYERRAPIPRRGAHLRDDALFVGLRKDGMVKAAISLHRAGKAGPWGVTGEEFCE